MRTCKACNEELSLESFYERRHKCKACIKKVNDARRDQKRAYDREHYQRNKERKQKINKRNYLINRENRIAAQAAYQKERYQNDPYYRLKCNLRTRLYNALDGVSKSSRTLELLGCTVEQFKLHIERQFEEGMRWGERDSFHLDHIIPLAAFDLSDPEQLKYAMHWSNFQPLWKEDNISKGDKHCPEELKMYLASELPAWES